VPSTKEQNCPELQQPIPPQHVCTDKQQPLPQHICPDSQQKLPSQHGCPDPQQPLPQRVCPTGHIFPAIVGIKVVPAISKFIIVLALLANIPIVKKWEITNNKIILVMLTHFSA
jgi:hypothetical protein